MHWDIKFLQTLLNVIVSPKKLENLTSYLSFDTVFCRNIFLRNNVIKIGDFGISRILMGTNDMASTFVGTPYYMSPEVLKHEGYNSKSDVWYVPH